MNFLYVPLFINFAHLFTLKPIFNSIFRIKPDLSVILLYQSRSGPLYYIALTSTICPLSFALLLPHFEPFV
ncbi:hypothetical protein CW304_14415 [Bacillus sp. UFRGS-B20]|nr:hypothetical protein CW304_14415 [Bacillus sp. UFRGS-B20]